MGETVAGMGVCVTGREGECLYAAQEALEIAFPTLGAAAAAQLVCEALSYSCVRPLLVCEAFSF